MTDAPVNVSFLDNPHAPDVFADGATGFFLWNGNMRITFESVRVNHATTPGPLNRVVVGRLVMPLAAAENLARSLLDFIERQKENPEQAVQSTPTIQ